MQILLFIIFLVIYIYTLSLVMPSVYEKLENMDNFFLVMVFWMVIHMAIIFGVGVLWQITIIAGNLGVNLWTYLNLQ